MFRCLFQIWDPVDGRDMCLREPGATEDCRMQRRFSVLGARVAKLYKPALDAGGMSVTDQQRGARRSPPVHVRLLVSTAFPLLILSRSVPAAPRRRPCFSERWQGCYDGGEERRRDAPACNSGGS